MRPLPALAESRAAGRRRRRIEAQLRAGTRTLAWVCLEMGDQCGELGLLPASPRLESRWRHACPAFGRVAAAWRIGQRCPALGTVARPSSGVGGRNGREPSRPGDFRTRAADRRLPVLPQMTIAMSGCRSEIELKNQFRCGAPRAITNPYLAPGALIFWLKLRRGMSRTSSVEPHGRRTSFRG
jgi:hypothetical protein